MADDYRAAAYRDERPIHDQLIGHGLAALNAEQIAKLTLVELRRVREELARLNAHFAASAPAPASHRESDSEV